LDIRRDLALLLTLLAAALFVGIGSIQLGAPGAYYDELHQAPASFVWLGRDAGLFARGEVAGVPLFNMTYSGAIKSHLYGAWMWSTGQPFTLESWRWFGLLLGAFGILAFGALAAACVPWRRLGVALALVVTDATLLVGCRHDWGPIALAFLLRMTLLGLCLRGPGARPRLAAAVFGVLLGLLVYEKLSSLVAVVPLLVLWFAEPARRNAKNGLCVLSGGLVGALPVVLWNLQWLFGAGKVASLGQSGEPVSHSLGDLLALLRGVAVMPQGGVVQQFVFGVAVPAWMEGLEAGLLVVAVALALYCGGKWVRLCALGALLTVLGLWALPSRTGVHHWVLATPWAVLAVAFAAGRALGCVVGAWLLLRIGTLVLLATTLAGGAASPRWSPEMHRLAAFAAASEVGDVFVAGDWGVATQIACGAQGRPGAVVECHRDAALPDLAMARRVILVGLQPPSEVAPNAFAALREALLAAQWRAIENPAPLQDLRDLQVATFVRGD
jgi:hypothetical protein